ncbi:hypothetical protein C2E23DRAFT_829065 [Lenzites betulinus]|nr:hypothetical protein C2E23DRAFT_829065 [Lenzites betulinus]
MLVMSPHMLPSNEAAESHSHIHDMRYMTQQHAWPSYRTNVEGLPSAVPGPAEAEASSSASRYSTISSPSADPYGHDPHFVNSPLIRSRSPSRRSQLAGLPAEAHQFPPHHSTALYPSRYPQQHQARQDVVPFSINASSSNDQPDLTITRHGSTRPVPLESFQLPSSHPTQNVALNAPSSRPRTSYPVFHTASDLAAHHGIPQSLPPVPRTSKFAPASPAVSRSAPTPPVASSSFDLDFDSLVSNYMTMIKQSPEEPQIAQTMVSHAHVAEQDAVQVIMDLFPGPTSPEFSNDFSEFLTSPMEDSPFDEFLTTPAMGSADAAADLLTSPAIFDPDSFPDYGSMPLFGTGGVGMSSEANKVASQSQQPHPPFNFNGLYTMPSPTTPSLDPTSLHPSPRMGSVPAQSTPGRRPRKNAPTGTRKNITPEALVSMDAPIQTRKYVTPSATSRKEVPTAFLKKKRARSQAFGEEDELEDDVNIDQNDLEAIEAKRRQNTLAARRSRRRKLEYQRELEVGIEQEKEEKEMWKRRSAVLQALLESHGHEVPSFDSL